MKIWASKDYLFESLSFASTAVSLVTAFAIAVSASKAAASTY